MIGGDAGVGKTRLVKHLAARAEDVGGRAVVAHCVDLGDVGIPYLPFSEALRLLADGHDAVADVLATRPALARLLGPTGAPTTDDPAGASVDRLPLLDGIATTLAAAGAPGAPLVLVVEDLHWADPSTRDVLRFLVTRLRAEHLLLVLTYRADDVDRRHPLRPLLAELHRLDRVEHVELAPFTPDELRRFTTALQGGPLPEHHLADIQRRSDGNAFFAEELLAAGSIGGPLPWSLADVLHARLQDLPAPVHHLVRLASVGGRRVAEDLLLAVAARTPGLDGDGAAVTAVHGAVAHQVLTLEEDHLAFRHALVAEALYTDLLPGERAAAHRTFLAALLDDPDLGSAAERAHHALQGHDLTTALTSSWAAAQRARELLAPAEQRRHLEEVLSLWESVPDAADLIGHDRVHVALAAAGAAARHGQTVRAVQLARRAIEALDDDPVRQAGARHKLAQFLLDVDDLTGAVEQTDLALEALGDAPTRELAATLAVRGRIELNRDEDAAARDHLRRAMQVAEQVDAPVVEIEALASAAALESADPAEAVRLGEVAVRRAREVGAVMTEARCWQNLAVAHYEAGHLDEAEHVLARGIARTRETATSRSPFGVWMRLLTEVLRYVRGDLSDGGAPSDVPAPEAAMFAGVRAQAAVARGDTDALEQVDALRGLWDVDGFVALCGGSAGVDALTWAGRYDDAARLATDVTDHLARVWSPHFLGGIRLAALALGALAAGAEDPGARHDDGTRDTLRARADALVATAHDTARTGRTRSGELGPEGRAWLARADAEHARAVTALTDGPADPGRWEVTVAAFDYGHRYERARSRLRWAQALRAAGEPDRAAREAAETLAEAEAMGARPLAEATRTWARRARIALPGSRRTSSPLTDREDEVLALVARGLSNRQIGEELFITAKTVSVHVSNLLAKLDVSGRAEAVAVAARRGLLPLDVPAVPAGPRKERR
ncbi:helix-turn-helix transcriptional regulator [Isoptericola chiayiensis]|uniref:Helix-turn-helix transcriptional regulator n=1 Tax=Isoptericola chiayiensis TaxID=579446 RepID=A0ABP8YPD9_9MICO